MKRHFQSGNPSQTRMLGAHQSAPFTFGKTSDQGFSLIEVMSALLVVTFGLLAAGQLMCAALSSVSLARSKGTAVVAAQEKLELLADLYRRNPSASELTTGHHGPQQVRVVNPIDGSVLNLFGVFWSVSNVPDPRPGKVIVARLITVRVIPIRSDGTINEHASLNKSLSVTAIVSPRIE